MENIIWNDKSTIPEYENNLELYQNHILEQYKLYVEMADRISSRRNAANVFFLTLNTTILSAIGFLFEKALLVNPRWLVSIPLFGVVIFCVVWAWLIRSYRNLNSAKFKVVGYLEKKLPSSPYCSAEWKELGEGKDIRKYLPLTALENVVPIIFAIVYIFIGIYAIWIMK